MTVVVIALAIQIIIIAQIHTVLDHESGGTRTPTLAVHNTRVIPLSQAPAGSQRRTQKMLQYEGKVYFEQANDEMSGAARRRPAANATGLGVLNVRKTATALVLMPAA